MSELPSETAPMVACYLCGDTWETTPESRATAREEQERLFTEGERALPQEVVCDDCWPAVLRSLPTMEKV